MLGVGRDSKIKRISKVLALWTIGEQRKSVLHSRRDMKLGAAEDMPPHILPGKVESRLGPQKFQERNKGKDIIRGMEGS